MQGQTRTAVLAAGGTGGHMFPAEALARELTGRGWRVVLATDRRGETYAHAFPAEERLALDAATGRGPLGLLKAGVEILKGVLQARSAFARLGVEVVIGFGGYPSAPALLAALSQGRPTLIHEQNAVLGRTNRLLAGRVRAVASAFPTLEKAPAGVTPRLVGSPVRAEIAALFDQPYVAPTDRIRVLVTGGSQGARVLSETVPQALAALPPALRDRLAVQQQSRPETLETALKLYNDAGIVCIGAFVAPDEAVRRKAAERVGAERFLVVHLSAPLAVCRERDTDGHYALADAGELANFPGVSAPYEPPAQADLVIPTHEWSVAKCVDALVKLLESRGAI